MNISSTYNSGSSYDYTTAEEVLLSKEGFNVGENESMPETSNSSLEKTNKSTADNEGGVITKLIKSLASKEASGSAKVDTSSTEQLNTSTESLKEFGTQMKQVLAPDAQGNVHEEQMQFAIAHFLLAEKDQKLGKEYLDIFNEFIGSGTPPMSAEDAVKKTLKILVEKCKISETDAETINGISFTAAQLDNNTTELYDNRGSANDKTIAVMKEEDAIKTALEAMEQIESGEIIVKDRSLDAPSNTISGEYSAKGTASAQGSSGGSGGFLWKPVSESDGKLAVLLPASISDSAVSAEIHSELPPSDSTLIETGRNTNGFHEGRRIFRFSQDGSSYPDNCYIIARLSDGSTETYKIPESSSRVE